MSKIPLDAIPDLSDVQVIVKTSYSGQPPQVVEDQVTYPISTALLSVPGATTVRGFSFFGDSFIYVIFSDDTDLYWARSRVLEYLSQIKDQLPKSVEPKLGPDATGVGWIYQYALIDRSGKHDLSELKSLQDWKIKYQLQMIKGVAEVATIGGMDKQYKVEVDPNRLRGYYLTLSNVEDAIKNATLQRGGSVLEMAEAEYMVRLNGYISGVKDIGLISVPTLRRRTSINSVLLDDISFSIHQGPAIRRGVADLNGEGEVVGGIVVMRNGENALSTIKRVKKQLDEIRLRLPAGVEIVETYDRSEVIIRGVSNLAYRLSEELFLVVLICGLFLYHFRSSLVILVSLPAGIIIAFGVIHAQGINANIMSLGGVAIAIGAMVDASVVMLENVHKHLEKKPQLNLKISDSNFRQSLLEQRVKIITKAATEVGRPLFFSLLIITFSFIPVFTLQAQEARLFLPLAYTKTYAMAIAAGLSITLVPALMVFFIRGKIKKESENFLSRRLSDFYSPIIFWSIEKPKLVILLCFMLFSSIAIPICNTGGEFMPEMDEGDLLYMPTTLPSISIGKARQILQQTNRLIKTVPEVKQVFGKVGRAESATDPAPLTMIETTIRLNKREDWRKGMTLDKLKKELDQRVKIPSLSNAWLMPIKTRIDMQSTGINTPIGIKISGDNLLQLENMGKKLEAIIQQYSGTSSVFSDRSFGARYIDIDVDRYAAAHYGLSVNDILDTASVAIGGKNIVWNVEGRERYAINLRYPQQMRDSIEHLKTLQLIATEDTHVQLQDLASVKITTGPSVIKSENGQLNSWLYVTSKETDLANYVLAVQDLIRNNLSIPQGVSIKWVGQFQYMQRANERLTLIIPFTLLIIVTLLYLSFGSFVESAIVLVSVPFSLVGGLWLLFFLNINYSVATAIGFIALSGVAAEFGIVMLVYLREAVVRLKPESSTQLRQAVIDGAIKRVRPKTMTVVVILLGLLPIMLNHGTGSEIMQSIAAPMIGGMLSAPLVSMILIPVLFYAWNNRKLKKNEPVYINK